MNEGLVASAVKGQELDIDRYRIASEPFYAEVRGEVGLFTIAAQSRMPVMLKGPTGCGKTRFVQHMAHRLGVRLSRWPAMKTSPRPIWWGGICSRGKRLSGWMGP